MMLHEHKTNNTVYVVHWGLSSFHGNLIPRNNEDKQKLIIYLSVLTDDMQTGQCFSYCDEDINKDNPLLFSWSAIL